jgi:Zn-dependent protease with chaperone function
MSFALALTVGSIVVAWLSPPLLERAAGRHDPVTVLLAWCAATVAVILTFAVGIALLLAPHTAAHEWAERLAHHCWLAMRHGHVPVQDELVGGALALMLGVLAARVVVVAARQGRAQRASQLAHRDLLALLGDAPVPNRHTVLNLPHPTPMAYSIGGRNGLVVLSTGVQQLPPAQQAAVLSHERAHLRGRHHVLVTIAEILAAAIPWVPLTRRASHAVRVLVELCADAAAVRACGAPAVRGALIALAGVPSPAHTLSMAGADVPLRLRCLHSAGHSRSVSTRLALPLAAMSAPALVGLVAAIAMCA